MRLKKSMGWSDAETLDSVEVKPSYSGVVDNRSKRWAVCFGGTQIAWWSTKSEAVEQARKLRDVLKFR